MPPFSKLFILNTNSDFSNRITRTFTTVLCALISCLLAITLLSSSCRPSKTWACPPLVQSPLQFPQKQALASKLAHVSWLDLYQTVLHLGTKNNQYEAVKYLVETIDVTNLLNQQDNDGNTILHLAAAAKLNALKINLNVVNRRGYTALDVIEADASNSGALVILPALIDSGAKRCDQLPPGSPAIIQEQQCQTIQPVLRPKRTQSPMQNSRRKSHRHRREKQIELQNEGLRNARKTITIVAVLVATVTYTGGINPPGGFNQQTGKTMMGKKTSFQIFMVCNIIALFLSLGIVIFLVSIIPFRRKSLMKLLIITHKVMWVSMSFMAVAYIAGIWTILPHRRGGIWMLVALVSIGGGCTLAIFVGLAVLLGRHWLKKWERKKKNKYGSPQSKFEGLAVLLGRYWLKKRERKKNNKEGSGSPRSSISRLGELQTMRRGSNESSNSDIDSSVHGCHLY